MYRVLVCLGTEHDLRLVALAGAVCLLASAVAISLFHRARESRGAARLVWIGLDAAAGGCGIWATHFIAMLAYDPGMGAGYGVALTILSLALAMTLTAIGLCVALFGPSRLFLALGGGVVGLGIAAMHYTGMLALQLPAHIEWSTDIVTASVISGAVFSALALLVAARQDDLRHFLAATVLFTVAIVSHHFTAMGAVILVPDPMLVNDAMTIAPAGLSFWTAGAAAGVLGITLAAAMIDRRSKGELRRQKVLLDSAIGNMSQGLCMFDADGRLLLFNNRYCELMWQEAPSLNEKSLVDILRYQKAAQQFDGNPEEYVAALQSETQAGRIVERIIERHGRSIRIVDHPMKGGGWVATFEDITEWQRAQERISHMARHDALTNLPNRTLFREKLEQALRVAKRSDQLAVFCLDLDHFKDINDSLGHPVGDMMLKEVADRLGACVGENDTVARLGGDEFAVVQFCRDCDPTAVAVLASHIVEKIAAPYSIAGHQLVIGVSIGISLAPEDGTTPDELLQKADMALYRAKEEGRGTYRFFETGMDARAQARRVLELELRAAVQRGEIEVHYQPIRDVSRDRVVAFEALARWKHPLRGMIQPGTFIPVAEETGLIVALGELVLRQACIDAANWPQDVVVAVNLSPLQFKSATLVSDVEQTLRESGLSPHRLELEITESVLLQNSDATLATLHTLRDLGVRISLDDFGTGYSSLSYLRSFPFDKIKIDRSFVSEMATREDSMAIVRAVTGLGKSLGLTVTAEGVETEEQYELLRREGCTQVQGYLFSAPRPVAEVGKMLSKAPRRIVA